MGTRSRVKTVARLAAMTVLAAAALCAVAPAQGATVGIASHGVLTVGGNPAFPIGLSDPPAIGALTPDGQDGLDTVVKAGVRVFRVIPPDRSWGVSSGDIVNDIAYAHSWDTSASSRGAMTMVWLARLGHAAPGSADASALQNVVTSLAPDAGLGIWKGADEPFHDGLTPADLTYAYHEVHSLDPAHPLALIEAASGTAADLAPYSAVTDIHGVDVYPVGFRHPRPSLRPVGDRTALMASVTPNRAVTTALEICTSHSWDRSGSGAYVVPSPRQLRFMAYDAITHGARGLFFFGGDNPHCFASGDVTLGWNWTYWQTVAPLVEQLGPASRLYPALIAPGTGFGVRAGDGIRARTRTGTDGVRWVIAENRSPHRVRGTISRLPAGTRSARLYPSGARVTVSRRRIRAVFKPWAVHVYRLV